MEVNNQSFEHIHEIATVEEFDSTLREYSEELVVVSFCASWCKPCTKTTPLMERFKHRLDNHWKIDAKFYKVDVDNCPDLTDRFQIISLPTFIFFYRGTPINDIKGADMEKVITYTMMYYKNLGFQFTFNSDIDPDIDTQNYDYND